MDEKNAFNNDLDPEVIKVRDKIISKIGDKSLDEVNAVIKKLLNESMDEVTRLGALAARLKIIRSKIELLYERKVEIKPEVKKKVVSEPSKDTKPKNEDQWIRIKMLEAGDVNGKQIDKGVILDVKEEDGKKLIDSKKAEIVEEDTEGASPIQKSEKIEEKEIKEAKMETPEEAKMETPEEAKKETPEEAKKETPEEAKKETPEEAKKETPEEAK